MRYTSSRAGKPVTDADLTTLAAFRYTLRRFLRFSETAADAAGLTAQQYLALLAIKGSPDPDYVTVRVLAERLQIEHHSAVGLIDRLAERELVRRGTSPEDRREVRLGLTPRGLQLLRKVATANRGELAGMKNELIDLLGRLT